VPQFIVGIGYRGESVSARVADEGVDPAALVDDLPNRSLDLLSIGDIGGDGQRTSLRGDALQWLPPSAEHHHGGSFTGVPPCGRLTDAGTATGNDDYLAFHRAHHPLPFILLTPETPNTRGIRDRTAPRVR